MMGRPPKRCPLALLVLLLLLELLLVELSLLLSDDTDGERWRRTAAARGRGGAGASAAAASLARAKNCASVCWPSRRASPMRSATRRDDAASPLFFHFLPLFRFF
jgi:hypothetical protein